MIRRIFPGSIIAGITRTANAFVLAAIAIAAAPDRADALITITVREAAGNVLVQASGTYLTLGLTRETDPPPDPVDGVYPTNPFLSAPQLDGNFNFILTGATSVNAFLWRFDTVTEQPGTDFGSQLEGADFGTGPVVGIDQGFDPTIYAILPSGIPCTDIDNPCLITGSQSIYNTRSLSSLGLIPGTYTWAWGASDDQRLTLKIEAVPGPLPALGGAAAFAWSRRLRRRVNASNTLDSQLNGV